MQSFPRVLQSSIQERAAIASFLFLRRRRFMSVVVLRCVFLLLCVCDYEREKSVEPKFEL